MPAAVDRCVRRILPAIRRQYPNKTSEEQRQIAWGTCTKLWKEGKLYRSGEERVIYMGKNRRGKRDGTGPYKDSAQPKRGRKAGRKKGNC